MSSRSSSGSRTAPTMSSRRCTSRSGPEFPRRVRGDRCRLPRCGSLMDRLDGVRVLVVNDMRSVRQVVTDILECAGATVIPVDSAEDALEVLQRERPNVLLSDLSMPEGQDGYWLIGQVRALPPERGGTNPAAAVTGYTGPDHRARGLRAGGARRSTPRSKSWSCE